RISYILSIFSTNISPLLFFFSMIPPPPRSTLFPYTTLFRSRPRAECAGPVSRRLRSAYRHGDRLRALLRADRCRHRRCERRLRLLSARERGGSGGRGGRGGEVRGAARARRRDPDTRGTPARQRAPEARSRPAPRQGRLSRYFFSAASFFAAARCGLTTGAMRCWYGVPAHITYATVVSGSAFFG